MGAVFTIFLFLPLAVAVFILEQLGIDVSGYFEQTMESIKAWLSANPETAAVIGDSLKKAFDVIMKAAEIANSIFIS